MAQKATSIYFHFLSGSFYLPKRLDIKKFLTGIFKHYSKKVESVNYIFCTDEYLLSLNREYLAHDYYTDIITFELNQANEPVRADVYISIDSARNNAELYTVPVVQEIMRLLIHGALHLCGQKDKSKRDFQQMKALEETYLHKWFHVKH